MNAKQIAKTFCFHYALIYGLTMIVSYFWCLACGDETVSVEFFGYAMLFALAADAPIVIFWSRKELSSKQILIRMIIHCIVLEILLPTVGWYIGMWHGVGGFFVFFFVVLLVDVGVYAISYLILSFDAVNINSVLEKRKCEKTIKEDEDDGFGQDNRNTQS